MRLPNKLNFYRQSVIYSLTVILESLSRPLHPVGLYRMVKGKIGNDIVTYQEALACLYAMKMIDMNDKGELIRC